MARTNTEIDRELEKAVAALRELERTVATLLERVDSHRTQTDLRLDFLSKGSRTLRGGSPAGRGGAGAIARPAGRVREGHVELRTDFESLKRGIEDDRRQRRALWAGLILAVIAAILGLTKDWIAGAFHR